MARNSSLFRFDLWNLGFHGHLLADSSDVENGVHADDFAGCHGDAALFGLAEPGMLNHNAVSAGAKIHDAIETLIGGYRLANNSGSQIGYMHRCSGYNRPGSVRNDAFDG